MSRLFLIIVIALFAASCRKSGDYIYHNLPLEEVAQIAKKENKTFCVVLSRSDCPPCETYIERIAANGAFYEHKAVFDIVDINLAENKWYQRWLGVTATPTTAVFAPNGELIAVVEGNGRSSHDCIALSVQGATKCMEYIYNPPVFPDMNRHEVLQTLNGVLNYLHDGDDKGLNEVQEYPYSAYLQAVNARDKGRAEQAAVYAGRFLSLVGNNIQLWRLYADLTVETMSMIEPDYDPLNDAVLLADDRVVVDNCTANEPRYFSLTVENSGKKDLVVEDVTVSCSCLSLLSDKQFTLKPGETGKMEFAIDGPYRGTVKQFIALFSNSKYNPIKDIEINAIYPLV